MLIFLSRRLLYGIIKLYGEYGVNNLNTVPGAAYCRKKKKGKRKKRKPKKKGCQIISNSGWVSVLKLYSNHPQKPQPQPSWYALLYLVLIPETEIQLTLRRCNWRAESSLHSAYFSIRPITNCGIRSTRTTTKNDKQREHCWCCNIFICWFVDIKWTDSLQIQTRRARIEKININARGWSRLAEPE